MGEVLTLEGVSGLFNGGEDSRVEQGLDKEIISCMVCKKQYLSGRAGGGG